MTSQRRAVIFLNGDLSDVSAIKQHITTGTLLIGCDGGTEHILTLGYTPDVVIGDFDSFPYPPAAVRKSATQPTYIRYPTDKDVTDAELALSYAAGQGYCGIILTGTLGTRLDHVLGNIFLLTKRQFARLNIRIIEGRQTIYIIRTQAQIRGKKGDIISLIPIKGTARATSRGLKYELGQYHLSLQGNTGISNVLTGPSAEVTVQTGMLLAVHHSKAV